MLPPQGSNRPVMHPFRATGAISFAPYSGRMIQLSLSTLMDALYSPIATMRKQRVLSPRRKRYTCLLLGLLLYSTTLSANDSVPVTRLSIEQGLSNNSVRAIYKDGNGFMWFGTYDGLNRYDGYSFKIFRNKLNDTASLPHNYIYALAEDAQNNLWVGTGQGIGIYNPKTEKFSSLYYEDALTRQTEKAAAAVNVIGADAESSVFAGLNGKGLLILAKGATAAKQIPCEKAGRLTTDYNVQGLAVDKRQTVWLFVADKGLCVYNRKRKKIEGINDGLRNVNCLVAGDNCIWLGTANGLYRYDAATRLLTRISPTNYGRLSHENVASLFFDKEKLWAGTEGGGISILDVTRKTIEYLLPSENGSGLTSESVFAIYVDGQARKWIGTIKGGINLLDPVKRRFKTVAHDPLNSNSLVNNFAASFYEDRTGNLWVGTDGGGISIWNRKTARFTNYRHQAGNPSSLSHNQVTSILQDYEGATWMATFGGGINKFIPGKHSFERYPCINPATGAENNRVWLLYEDREKTVWATTFGQGRVYRFNRTANRFDVFDQALNDIVSLCEDANGALWGGNSHQLIKIDKGGGRHTVYEIGKPVRSLHESRTGDFWVGTEGGGLLLFNRQQGRVVARYSDADGLCNNSVLSVLEDKSGRLWLSTFNGLSRFTPADMSFKNFYAADGLQSNQFLYSAGLKLASGEMVFGGVKGFTLFSPDSLASQKGFAPLVLTSLHVNNAPVSAANAYVTQLNNGRIAALKIPYDEASLAFEYAALEYSAPEKISYAYYLERWDKGWNNAGSIRRAAYTRLKEGTYRLRIKATNTEGDWNPEEQVIRLTVLPPWYRTGWAYALYALAAGGLVYFYIRYKTRQARLQYHLKLTKLAAEKEQARLQYDLQLTQMAAEKERELTEKRLSFFTDISHEFRTPLTLIINPVKDLLKKAEEPEERKELGIVNRNARRLLSLVDQLLLFRKAEAGADSLRFSKQNFYTLCHEVCLCFVQQAKLNGQAYLFECPAQNLPLYVDSEKIEIALYNLLSNAVKYTPKGGRIVFRVSETETEVRVEVEDNGPGIPNESAERLFEKFYQVPSANGAAPGGFGIGLYLVKHFVEAHKGRVSFESEEGKGTTFFIALQKGKEHLAGQIVLKEAEAGLKKAPQVEAAEPEPGPPAPAKEGAGLEEVVTSRQSVLVADDNEEIRDYLKEILSGRYRVLTAGSGEEALAQTHTAFPDMVISDIRMDGMSGIDLCKAIKSNDALSHIPVVLLTGSSGPGVELQSVEGGADVYITKPFDKDILLGKVDNLFKSRNELQNYFFNEITLKKNTLKISPEYKEFLDRCIAIAEEHLDDDQFGVKPLAKELGMSHSALYRRVRTVSGQSVNGFIRYIRLRKAAELLLKGDCNVNQAAFQVGIADVKYFRAQFNKLFGMNPSDYVKKYRQPFNEAYNLSPGAVKKESSK